MGLGGSKPEPKQHGVWLSYLKRLAYLEEPKEQPTIFGMTYGTFVTTITVQAVLLAGALYYVYYTSNSKQKRKTRKDAIAKTINMKELENYPDINADHKELIKIVGESLEQLYMNIIIETQPKARPKTIRKKYFPTEKKESLVESLEAMNHQSLDNNKDTKKRRSTLASIASSMTTSYSDHSDSDGEKSKKDKKGKNKDKKNAPLTISAPIPSAATSFATGTAEKSCHSKESVCKLDGNDKPYYKTQVPKLGLHTHSHNVVHRLQNIKNINQEKACQYMSELVCGKHAGKVIGNISKWKRNIDCVWSNGQYDVLIALTDWSFKEVDGEWVAQRNKGTTGTSWRRIPGTDNSTNLMNVYSTHVAESHTISRSGIIDTKKKAKQLKNVLIQLTKERNQRNLNNNDYCDRILSVSLVSTSSLAGDEKEMAKQQHSTLLNTVSCHGPKDNGERRKSSLITATKGENDDTVSQFTMCDPVEGLDLVHVNYQTNVNEISGVSLGEKSSRRLNNFALVRISQWCLCDAKSAVKNVKTFSGMNDLESLIEITSLDALGDEVTKKLADKMTSLSQAFTKAFPEYAKESAGPFSNQYQNKTKMLNVTVALKCISTLLNTHVNESGISRVCELVLLSLVHASLGILLCVNCKSGCDRTGLMFAIASAVDTMWESRPNERFEFAEMCIKFDSYTEKHEGFYSKGLGVWSQYVAKLEPTTDENHHSLLCCEFRNIIFLNFMEVGWKCILYSTGLPGFKVGSEKSMLKNPHVTPLLPPFISSIDGTHMNTEFRDFFIGASQYRGGNASDSVNVSEN